MSYKTRPATLLSEFTDLKGKKVLEVGGGFEFESARAFLEHGAESVTVTNIGHGVETATPEPGIEVKYADATRLSEYIDEQYDIVFGTAVIEHIPSTSQWLSETKKALSPNGYVYYSGGPLWTCAAGHHVFVKSEGREYLFTNSTNPIPNWGHLLLGREGIAQKLEKKSIPAEDIDKIIEFIFDSNEVNRVHHGCIREEFDSSNMRTVYMKENRREISDFMQNKLQEKAGKSSDYGVSGIEYIQVNTN